MILEIVLFVALLAVGNSQWSISLLSTYESGIEEGAEVSAYHIASARVFVANVAASRIDVLNINSDGDINYFRSINITSGPPNSIDISGNLLAVVSSNSDTLSAGKLHIFDLKHGSVRFLASLEVGVGPDHVKFSPNGKYLICANEGEPDEGITVAQDPLGTITVVKIPDNLGVIDQSMVTTLDFTAYDNTPPPGVRLSGPEGLKVSQDLEPEYIAVSKDSSTAFVTLQEANSIAIVDLSVPLITDIWPLHLVDRGIVPFDASNKDDAINIQLWPNVYGMPQPDSISYTEIGGNGFLVIANEGDAKEYADYYTDEIRVKDIEPSRFDENAFDVASIQDEAALGRLKVSSAAGDLPETGIDSLYHFGARSFSILSATDGSLIYDSGSDFEELTALVLPSIFNCGDDNLDFDDRSDDKGPEPESTATAELDGKHYVFVTLERVGGVVMYNIDNPNNPQFVTYFNNRDLTDLDGDLDPEGLQVVKAEDSPTGDVLLIINAAVTGQTSVYRVAKDTDQVSYDTPDESPPGPISSCECTGPGLCTEQTEEDVCLSTADDVCDWECVGSGGGGDGGGDGGDGGGGGGCKCTGPGRCPDQDRDACERYQICSYDCGQGPPDESPPGGQLTCCMATQDRGPGSSTGTCGTINDVGECFTRRGCEWRCTGYNDGDGDDNNDSSGSSGINTGSGGSSEINTGSSSGIATGSSSGIATGSSSGIATGSGDALGETQALP